MQTCGRESGFLEKPCDDSYHDTIFWYLNIGTNRPTTFSVLLIVFLKAFMSIWKTKSGRTQLKYV